MNTNQATSTQPVDYLKWVDDSFHAIKNNKSMRKMLALLNERGGLIYCLPKGELRCQNKDNFESVVGLKNVVHLNDKGVWEWASLHNKINLYPPTGNYQPSLFDTPWLWGEKVFIASKIDIKEEPEMLYAESVWVKIITQDRGTYFWQRQSFSVFDKHGRYLKEWFISDDQFHEEETEAILVADKQRIRATHIRDRYQPYPKPAPSPLDVMAREMNRLGK